MLRIAIVDDEEKWREYVYDNVKTYFKTADIMIHTYESGEHFLAKAMQYDIVFMDIEMKRIDGLRTAGQYKRRYSEAIIIILTTHTEMSRLGYLLNVFRYIDKVNIQEELREALVSAEHRMGRNKTVCVDEVSSGKRELVLKDILYIETDRHNVLIHTTASIVECSNKISDLEELLEEHGFYKIHKSYLINLDAIKSISSIEKTTVRLKDETDLCLSIRKYPELKRRYASRVFEFANA